MELSTDQQNDGGILSSKTSSSLIIDAAEVGCYEKTRRSRADWRELHHSGIEAHQNVTLTASDSCVVRSLTCTVYACLCTVHIAELDTEDSPKLHLQDLSLHIEEVEMGIRVRAFLKF